MKKANREKAARAGSETKRTSGSGRGICPTCGLSEGSTDILGVVREGIVLFGSIAIRLVEGITNTTTACFLISGLTIVSVTYILPMSPTDRKDLSGLRCLVEAFSGAVSSSVVNAALVFLSVLLVVLLVVVTAVLNRRCQRLGDQDTTARNKKEPGRISSGDPSTWPDLEQ